MATKGDVWTCVKGESEDADNLGTPPPSCGSSIYYPLEGSAPDECRLLRRYTNAVE
jgi:hypothetical protein